MTIIPCGLIVLDIGSNGHIVGIEIMDAAHAVELEPGAKYHGSVASSVVPVALGVAEKFNLPGKTVLEGVIIGTELHGKIGRAAHKAGDRGFVGLGVYGPLALAAEASKMMELSVEQTVMAIS